MTPDLKKLRVLFVCTVPTDKSGIPNVMFNLLGALDKSNMELGYVAINDPSDFYKRRLKELGVTLHIIPRKITAPWAYITHLAKVARGYNVMHVHGNSATLVLEMIAAKLAGVKVRIAHSHNTQCSMVKIDKAARPLFYALCNARLACGVEAGKWLFGNRDFKVINNGINTDRFRFKESTRHEIREGLEWENVPIIGHIGNFVEQKNHRFLIDVFNAIHHKNPDVKLLLLGSGPLQEEIMNRVKELGLLDSVCFTDSVDNPEEYMCAMDMIVMPSLFEGLPLTLVEEQANGLPCLVADTITRDADMTGLVSYKSLSDSPEYWAISALDILNNSERTKDISLSSIASIKAANFDIYEVAKDLKAYYYEQL